MPTGKLKFVGEVKLQILDQLGRIIHREVFFNDFTTEGLTHLLDAAFNQATQSTWYIGLINATGYTGIDPSYTMSSHAGWTEVTAYSGNRPQWDNLAVAGGVILNEIPVSFTMTGSASIKGIFLASNATKSGTTGTLWNQAIFPATRSLVAGQELRITYTLRAVGSS